jgi:hypothetical protein
VFVVGDCTDPVVSISQVHKANYLLESEAKLRLYFTNVPEKLKPGGLFLDTIPDAT